MSILTKEQLEQLGSNAKARPYHVRYLEVPDLLDTIADLRAREQAARLEERERCIGILEFYGHKGMANALREELP